MLKILSLYLVKIYMHCQPKSVPRVTQNHLENTLLNKALFKRPGKILRITLSKTLKIRGKDSRSK